MCIAGAVLLVRLNRFIGITRDQRFGCICQVSDPVTIFGVCTRKREFLGINQEHVQKQLEVSRDYQQQQHIPHVMEFSKVSPVHCYKDTEHKFKNRKKNEPHTTVVFHEVRQTFNITYYTCYIGSTVT